MPSTKQFQSAIHCHLPGITQTIALPLYFLIGKAQATSRRVFTRAFRAAECFDAPRLVWHAAEGSPWWG